MSLALGKQGVGLIKKMCALHCKVKDRPPTTTYCAATIQAYLGSGQRGPAELDAEAAETTRLDASVS